MVAAFVIAPSLLLGALCLATSAGAQVTTVETVPPEVDEEGRTAGDRVDQIVMTLRVIAGLMLVASGVYWWQTRPDRVVRAAVARGELERATARVEADAAAALAAQDTGSPEPEPVPEEVEPERVSEPVSEEVEPEPESERVSAEAVPIRSRSSADVLTDVATATGNGRGGPET
ncbi:MAG: hypothetical protein MK189_00495 [Acidimicrobiales bacterium]|nr:hypothetical protein [Acidimicrobiales bacterium]